MCYRTHAVWRVYGNTLPYTACKIHVDTLYNSTYDKLSTMGYHGILIIHFTRGNQTFYKLWDNGSWGMVKIWRNDYNEALNQPSICVRTTNTQDIENIEISSNIGLFSKMQDGNFYDLYRQVPS